VIVDPSGLNASVDGVYEAPIAQFGGISRMVNRNDEAVDATVVAGEVVFRGGRFTAGKNGGQTGRFLRAGAYSRDIDSTEQLIRSAL
jgi:N-acyl-D-aspartate/D-glutamate deacylase